MRQFDDDYEIDAIEKCSRALSRVDDKTKIRVLRFLLDKFGLLAHPEASSNKGDDSNGQQPANLALITPEKVATANSSSFKDGTPIVIKDILIKGLTKTEPELILIIAYNNTDFGTGTCTRQSILESYQDNGISTEIRKKNFAKNLNSLIKKGYVNSITEDEISVASEGIEHAKNILSGNSTTKKRKPRIKKAKPVKADNQPDNENEEEELTADEES